MRADRSFATVLVVLLGALLAGRPAVAGPADGASPVSPPLRRLAIAQPPPEPYVPPGANLVPVPERRRPLERQWWFWAAVGAVVATTVAVIVIATRPPSAPGSTLGNMEAFGGH
jgi:hypothetical protein